MLYGDQVTLASDRIIVPSKELHPISIHDNSKCWGVAVPPADHRDLGRHYVLSPVHPESWPVAFRLDIKLRNVVGAMAQASRVINSHGVNILFAECTQSGYSHATWSTLCESLALKDYVLDQRPIPAPGAHRYCDEFFANHISASMFIHMHQVAQKIVLTDHVLRQINITIDEAIARADCYTYHAAATQLRSAVDSNEDRGFLAPGFLFRRANLAWNITLEHLRSAYQHTKVQDSLRHNNILVEERDLEFLGPMIALHNTPAVAASPVPNLMSFWSRMRPNSIPAGWEFDSSTNAFVPNEPTLYERAIKGYDIPLRVDASFDSLERYVRIMLPPKDHVDKRLSIRIPYNVEFSEDVPSRRSSAGALFRICDMLTKKNVNIVNIANTVTHRTLPSHTNIDIEKGAIDIIGLSPVAHRSTEAASLYESIRADISRLELPNSKSDFSKTQVDPDLPDGVFVSTRFQSEWIKDSFTDSEQDLVDIVTQALAKHGLRAIVVDSKEMITDDVQDGLSRARGFLQLIPLLRNEPNPSAANLTWLHIEYGMALARRIPRIRVVDTRPNGVTIDTWTSALKANKEEPALEFDSMRSFVKVVLPDAVSRMASRIAR